MPRVVRALGWTQWRATPTTPRSASATRSTWSTSSARAPSCAGRAPTARGPVPVPRRAHAVVRDQPGREGLPLLRLRRGRRRVQVRPGDRGPGLRRRAGVAGRPLRRRRSSSSEEDPQAAAAARSSASGCSSCSSAPRPSTRATCGSRRRRAGARDVPGRPRPGRGRAARVPRRLRAERVGHACSCAVAPAPASPRTSCYAAGLAQRSAEERAASTTASARRIMFPLCDPRGRVLGFGGARAGRRPAARSTSTPPRASSSTRAGSSSAPTSPAPPAAKARPGRRLPRATPTSSPCTRRASQRRRDDGHGADRATGRRAGAAGARRVLLALDADAAGQEAMLRGARASRRRATCELASSPLPAGERSGRPRRSARAREAMRALIDGVGAVRALPRRARARDADLDERGGQGPRHRGAARGVRRAAADALREELRRPGGRSHRTRAGARGLVAGAGSGAVAALARRRAATAHRSGGRALRSRRSTPRAAPSATSWRSARRPGPAGSTRSGRWISRRVLDGNGRGVRPNTSARGSPARTSTCPTTTKTTCPPRSPRSGSGRADQRVGAASKPERLKLERVALRREIAAARAAARPTYERPGLRRD